MGVVVPVPLCLYSRTFVYRYQPVLLKVDNTECFRIGLVGCLLSTTAGCRPRSALSCVLTTYLL